MKSAWKWILVVLLLAGVVLSLRCLSMEGAGSLITGLSKDTARALIRVAVVALALCGWFVTQSLISAKGMPQGRIGDAVHDWSERLHGYLMRNERKTNTLLIASSAFIDLFALTIIGIALLGPTIRPFVALLILFIFRQVCQLTVSLPAPKDMIWRNPGFPSLLVTYGVANDFFISGHTAIAVLGAIEIANIAPLYLGIAAGVIALLEALTVLVLRAHYTMDVLAAIPAAFFAYALSLILCKGF
jgi:hypothetical protein